MKKEYVAPTMVCEEFAANEYVAACGDENRVYKFVCDAPDGPLYAKDSQGKGYQGADYEDCGKVHEAPVDSVFVDGFVDYDHDGKKDAGEEVKVWLEYGWKGKKWTVVNGHATKNIDMKSWETAKS